MKLKKYQAKTMPEVMQQVRKDLGPEAVILNSKTIESGGFMGLFKKKHIEVVAAVDRQSTPRQIKKQPKPVATIQPKHTSDHALKTFIAKETKTEKEQQLVLEELRSLRKWMEDSTEQKSDFPAGYDRIYHELIEADVSKETSKQLVEEILNKNGDHDVVYEEIKSDVYERIENVFYETASGVMSFQSKFVHLVGPTGVGKTTTIAKLAAKSLMEDKQSVALITTDTYRIAAIEQLKTYAKILDIPIEVCYTVEDYQMARLKFQDYDRVFVDTAGRNFKDEKYIRELGRIVDLSKDIETYLVLTLTAKPKDVLSIYQQFDNIPLKGFILTKADETDTLGVVLDLVKTANIGVSFVTTGQDVPDDITRATPEYMASKIMRTTQHE
ncbi:flagellar biosynthesis protein FlhF [Halolactibacillus alkaliphilus]|uniref:Flagellar biosynthesis protein FlhF n=1 Tax=Halolactibacillus alkaliphilus TaxID=442899 RepID=A0A511WXF0_9BACI|nr:flagellar biosynthesis protein FlhF [Halolactibacillus alkaliphilus]GEN55796.1 flagellar biosynthesis protein FlhF [Halolactibacillus alkaliphilus]GGN64914.1 flagellar biosynthesis protein FlhF [Halolactibacillus alkaliphilus]SFO64721.1 flagellar biosynthesis protein FlhF [Halolactibacillus alkaliphilus]